MSVPYVIGQTLTPVAHYTQVLLFNSTTEFTHKLLLNLITHAKCARTHTHIFYFNPTANTDFLNVNLQRSVAYYTLVLKHKNIHAHTGLSAIC